MSWETFRRLWRWGNGLALLGVLQFAGCLILAVQLYPGGSPLDEHTVGYSFGGNFLSDLGRHVAWSGVPNTWASLLFNGSLLLLAATLVPFFLFLPLHASDRAGTLWIATGFGLLSCWGLAGLGCTPYDAHLGAHMRALMWWSIPLLVSLLIHFWALLGSEECSPLYALVSLAVALLVAAYLVRTLIFGLPPHSQDDADSLLTSIVLQKYVLLACVGWYFVFSARGLFVLQDPGTVRESRVDDAAQEYLRRLRQGTGGDVPE
jgi:hypothetical protein